MKEAKQVVKVNFFNVVMDAMSIIYDDGEEVDKDQVSAVVDQLKEAGYGLKAISSGVLPDDAWWERVQPELKLKSAQVVALRLAFKLMAERGKCKLHAGRAYKQRICYMQALVSTPRITPPHHHRLLHPPCPSPVLHAT